MSYRFRSTPTLETLERRALLSAGQLDPTFGGDGIVSVAASGAFEDVALLPGNKLLAVGTTSNTAGAHSAYLARFNADGSYDTSFGGGDGVATGDFGAHRLALQTDGKVLVFGSALARFNADGTPDTSFGGGDGVVVPQAPGDGLGLQLDGKILTVEGDRVTRYNRDGSLDTTFGAGGRVALDRPLGRSPWRTDGGPFDGFVPVDVAWQIESGKIVVGGHTAGSGPVVDFAAVRLNADGSLDTAFANGSGMASVGSPASDTGGRIDVALDGTIAMAGNENLYDQPDVVLFEHNGTTARYAATPWIDGQARDVSFTPDGRIVVAGYGQQINPVPDTLQRDVEVMRFNRDLTVDASFGGPAGVHTDPTGHYADDFGFGVAVGVDGSVVVAGQSDGSPVLLRYGGELDPSFGGGDGIVSVAAVGSFNDVTALPGGKLLAVGTTSTTATGRDVYLARFNADGSFDTTFGGGDGSITADFGPGDDGRRLAVQSDGKIVVFGSVLARFKADGTLDTTFGGGDGVVTPSATGDGLSLQPDGKILTAEGNVNNGPAGTWVARYNSDGSLDTSFGGSGRVSFNFPIGPTRPDYGQYSGFVPLDVAWQASSGKIIVGGQTPDFGVTADFAVARLNVDGSVDWSFGNGTGLAAQGSDTDLGGRIDVAPDGTIAMAGNEDDNDTDLVLVDNDGTWTQVKRIGWIDGNIRDVSFTPDGKIVVVGDGLHAGYNNQHDIEVARLNRDLSIDETFGGPQAVHTDVNHNGSEDFGFGVAVTDDGDIVVAGSSDDSPVLLRYDGGGLAAPQVVRAFVGSTGWSAAFLHALDQGSGDDRYGIVAGSGSAAAPASPLPWTNLDQVAIQFNRPVSVEQNDLHVRGVNVADYGFGAFRYDPATRTAVWTLDRAVGADKLLLQLDGVELAGAGGTGGVAPYRSRIDVLPGDVNGDGAVLADDFSDVKRRFFSTTTNRGSGNSAYTPFADVNGSGSILADDYSAVKQRFFTKLPASEPATAAALQSVAAVRPRPITRTLFSGAPVLD